MVPMLLKSGRNGSELAKWHLGGRHPWGAS